MPKKKTEDNIPATSVSKPRAKAPSPVAAESAAETIVKAKPLIAKAKPLVTEAEPVIAGTKPVAAKAKPVAKTLRARKTVPAAADNSAATNSLLKLNGAVNGHLTSEQIAQRAYFLWLEKGCPEGTADQDWIDAERELSAH